MSMTVWQAMDLIKEVGRIFFFLVTIQDRIFNPLVDESDPDTDQPQIVHALQTAEGIRRKYSEEKYDWFPLTGLIHDLGKVLGE